MCFLGKSSLSLPYFCHWAQKEEREGQENKYTSLYNDLWRIYVVNHLAFSAACPGDIAQTPRGESTG